VDVKLKQRLLGAVILTSLAIIVLPALFNGSEEERIRLKSSAPEPPQIAVDRLTVQDVALKIEQRARDSEARLPREVVDETNYLNRSDFIFDKNNLPVNWSIRLGSFKDKQNALRLRETLRAKNYRSYILYAKNNSGDLFRVFVGPSSSKSALAEIADKIEGTLNLKGQIVRYRIEDNKEMLSG
tara:strand:+ start:152 stop:703 length:552 start_codon:yes stop_codon:yes gene_type:complete